MVDIPLAYWKLTVVRVHLRARPPSVTTAGPERLRVHRVPFP